MTNYFDFLTTETLTLTVPLLFMIWLEKEERGQKAENVTFSVVGKALVFWLFGYAGMWIMKWGIAAIVLSENIMPYVAGHIGERIGGDLGFQPV